MFTENDENIKIVNSNNPLTQEEIDQISTTVKDSYIPVRVFDGDIVDEKDVYEKDGIRYINKNIEKETGKAFSDMTEFLRKKHVNLMATDGYRTIDEQEKIKTEAIHQDDKEFVEGTSVKSKILDILKGKSKSSNSDKVADPYTSEHHTGRAIDISVGIKANGILKNGTFIYKAVNKVFQPLMFRKLSLESYKYGFIRRYDDKFKDITNVPSERWHYTYVGKNNAKAIFMLGVPLEVFDYMAKNNMLNSNIVELIQKNDRAELKKIGKNAVEMYRNSIVKDDMTL